MPDIEKLKVKTGPTTTSFDISDARARQLVSRANGKLDTIEYETIPMIDMNIEALRAQVENDYTYLNDKIKDLELFKFPNATIVGSPNIENGQVKNFSAENYLIFPMIIDVRNIPFQIDINLHTYIWQSGDQQNILDSRFGLALAIKNNHLDVALSSNGTSWDIGEGIGHKYINPGTDYYIRLLWDGDFYKVQISDDGTEYIDDIIITSQLGLHPTQIFIGSSPNIFGPDTAHPFEGSINLNKCYLRIDNKVIWSGMDDAGLATRADLSLSNIDEAGKEVIRDIADEGPYFELIENITLEESSMPIINLPNLSSIAIKVITGGAGDGYSSFNVSFDDDSHFPIASAPLAANRYLTAICIKHGNYLSAIATTYVSGPQSTQSIITNPTALFNEARIINRIYVSGNNLPANTNIRIYGVRA